MKIAQLHLKVINIALRYSLNRSLPYLLRLAPVFSFTLILYAQTVPGTIADGSNIPVGLIWFELVFCIGLAFHAGINVNKISSLEHRTKDIEDEKHGEKLAAIEAKLDMLLRVNHHEQNHS